MSLSDQTEPTPLIEAFELVTDPHTDVGSLIAQVSGDFSNGPQSYPPEKGFPFGGLIAALAVKAMQQSLEIENPLLTLSLQFMAPARYGHPLIFSSRTLRRGRSVTYAAVEALQGERMVLNANATFGLNDDYPEPHTDLHRVPPPLDDMRPGPGLYGPMAPHFTRYIEYRFETGPNILGGNIGKEPVERLWMRTNDGAPLDTLRLCFLLDALYPPAMTLSQTYLKMTSVDIRYDLLCPVTPELAPDGWVFFEYRILEHDHGWSIDDVTAWTPDGRAIAIARQRRKVL